MISTNECFKKITDPLSELEELFVRFFNEQYDNAELKLISIEERASFFDDEGSLQVKFVYTSYGELDVHRSLDFTLLIQPFLDELNEKRLIVDSYITYDDYMENTPKEELVI
ncbi:MAG: hypothetical protein OXE59_06595 [Bacteroidetes bacterium]|nr:hypothetical protein [Bacteroidota bacterium]